MFICLCVHSFVHPFVPLICPDLMSDHTGRISLGIDRCTIYWLFKSTLSVFSILSSRCSFYAYLNLTFKKTKCFFFMVFTLIFLLGSIFCVHNLWYIWRILCLFCDVVNCRYWKILKNLNPLMNISSFTGIHIQDMLRSIMSTGLLRCA